MTKDITKAIGDIRTQLGCNMPFFRETDQLTLSLLQSHIEDSLIDIEKSLNLSLGATHYGEYVCADLYEAMKAEKLNWQKALGAVLGALPLKDILKAGSSTNDLIEWIKGAADKHKSQQARIEELEAALRECSRVNIEPLLQALQKISEYDHQKGAQDTIKYFIVQHLGVDEIRGFLEKVASTDIQSWASVALSKYNQSNLTNTSTTGNTNE